MATRWAQNWGRNDLAAFGYEAHEDGEKISYEAIQIDYDPEGNPYAAATKAKHRMDPRARAILVMAILLVLIYFIGLIVPKSLINQSYYYSGYGTGLTPAVFIAKLSENVQNLLAVLTNNPTTTNVFNTNMLRYVVVALSGAGLALCGAVYQGTFKNALVSPSTLGVMSGATLGMMLWVVFAIDDLGNQNDWLVALSSGFQEGMGVPAYLVTSYGLAICSFLGCCLVVGTVLLIMRLANGGRLSGVLMIICGQVVASIIGAITGSIRYYYITLNPDGTKAQLLTDLTISSYYRSFTVIDVVAIAIPLAITFAVVMRLRQRMMLLTFSEEESRSMGVDARRMQFAVVGLCTLLTAIIVSFCGRVGFVGFLVPHLARRFVGPSYKFLLPASAVLGAVFVLGAYVAVSITMGSGFETMVGMYISIAGAAVFLVTALRGEGGSRGTFN